MAWNGAPLALERPLLQRLREPEAGLGSGWSTWFYSRHPGLFRHLPEGTRVYRARTALGPAGASWLRARVEGQFPVLTSHVAGGRGRARTGWLSWSARRAEAPELTADHVIAATGYRPGPQPPELPGPRAAGQLDTVAGAPVVDRDYQTTVPGLFVVGPAVAPTFGPVMRFVFGSEHAARTVSRRLSAGAAARPRWPWGLAGERAGLPDRAAAARPATWVAEAAGASRDGAARAPARARAAGPAVAAAALPLADGLTLAAVAAAAALAGWPADRWLGSGRAGGGWAGGGWPGGWLLAGYLTVVFLALSASGLHRLRISLRVADQSGRIAAAVMLPGVMLLPAVPAGPVFRLVLGTAAALLVVRVAGLGRAARGAAARPADRAGPAGRGRPGWPGAGPAARRASRAGPAGAGIRGGHRPGGKHRGRPRQPRPSWPSRPGRWRQRRPAAAGAGRHRGPGRRGGPGGHQPGHRDGC